MKINVYKLEIDATDEISVSGLGADSFLRVGEAVLTVAPDAIDKFLDEVSQLRINMAEVPK